MIEEWRSAEVGLQVSNYGRVLRRGKLVHAPKGSIFVKGRGKVNIGRLVLELFIGPCPEGMECCHYDDDRSNNSLSNMRWDTHANNVEDWLRNGGREVFKVPVGEKNGSAKLTAELVTWARQVWALDPKLWSYGKIAQRLGVSKKAVQKLLQRKTWSHIP